MEGKPAHVTGHICTVVQPTSSTHCKEGMQSDFILSSRSLYLVIYMQVSNFRSPISVEERVAVTIWKLATNVEYRTLSALFGLGRSTICTIVVNTCHAIETHLLPECVQIPSGNRMKEVVEGFEKYWGFPQAAGAIDGTHIPIVRPQESAYDYYNRKGFYSIIMQALVDFRGLFTDVYIGWPGKVHDASVFVKLFHIPQREK